MCDWYVVDALLGRAYGRGPRAASACGGQREREIVDAIAQGALLMHALVGNTFTFEF